MKAVATASTYDGLGFEVVKRWMSLCAMVGAVFGCSTRCLSSASTWEGVNTKSETQVTVIFIN